MGRGSLDGEVDDGGNSRVTTERLQGAVKAVGGRLLAVANAVGAVTPPPPLGPWVMSQQTFYRGGGEAADSSPSPTAGARTKGN